MEQELVESKARGVKPSEWYMSFPGAFRHVFQTESVEDFMGLPPKPEQVPDTAPQPADPAAEPEKSVEERVTAILDTLKYDKDGTLDDAEVASAPLGVFLFSIFSNRILCGQVVQLERLAGKHFDSATLNLDDHDAEPRDSRLHVSAGLVSVANELHPSHLADGAQITRLERIEIAQKLKPKPTPGEISSAELCSAARVIYARQMPSIINLSDDELLPIVENNARLKRLATQHAADKAWELTPSLLEPATRDDWQLRVDEASAEGRLKYDYDAKGARGWADKYDDTTGRGGSARSALPQR